MPLPRHGQRGYRYSDLKVTQVAFVPIETSLSYMTGGPLSAINIIYLMEKGGYSLGY